MKNILWIIFFSSIFLFLSCKERNPGRYYYNVGNYVVKDTVFDKNHRLTQIISVNKYDSTRILYKSFYRNGNIQVKGFYYNLKKEGPYFLYSSKGEIAAKYFFKNGFKNGKAVIYYGDDEIYQIMHFKMGKKVGTWKTFDTTGHVIDSTVY